MTEQDLLEIKQLENILVKIENANKRREFAILEKIDYELLTEIFIYFSLLDASKMKNIDIASNDVFRNIYYKLKPAILENDKFRQIWKRKSNGNGKIINWNFLAEI